MTLFDAVSKQEIFAEAARDLLLEREGSGDARHIADSSRALPYLVQSRLSNFVFQAAGTVQSDEAKLSDVLAELNEPSLSQLVHDQPEQRIDRRFSAMSQRAYCHACGRSHHLCPDAVLPLLRSLHSLALPAAAAPFNVQSSIWFRRSLRGGSGASLAQHKPLF
jgi:hypothetical protein